MMTGWPRQPSQNVIPSEGVKRVNRGISAGWRLADTIDMTIFDRHMERDATSLLPRLPVERIVALEAEKHRFRTQLDPKQPLYAIADLSGQRDQIGGCSASEVDEGERMG